MSTSTPKPPHHLSAAAKRWFREIAEEYGISDRPGLLLLASAATCWDRAEECRVAIARDGVSLSDRFGQVRPHPLLAAIRDAEGGFRAAFKALQLDIAAIQTGGSHAKRHT